MLICHLAPCERQWKMWPRAVILVLFLEDIASTQSVITKETEPGRQARQLNFGECCPCSDESSVRSQDRWLNPNARNFALTENGNGGQFLKNGLGSFRSGFDDCPCRLRSADSEGSSSIFFPSELRPNDPSIKSGSKEDPKNLLEPEVGLASSVLETLKKATDEEYRDALARDSARARAAEDAVPEESAPNIVTIIIPNQDDEEFTSGSHIQEPRCIRPLGSPIARMRTPMKKPPNVITEIFRLPKAKPVGILHRHSLDVDSGFGASNIQERVVNAEDRNIKLKTNRILLKNDEGVCETNFRKGPSLKSVPLLEKEPARQNNVLRSSIINKPKTRLDASPKDVCNTHNTDMKSAASDTKELFARPELNLGSLTPEIDPLNLKTLLKLRDVELLSPSQLLEKLKVNAPALQLPPLIESIPKLSDILKNGIKFNLNKNGQWNNAKDGDDSIESSASNIQVIPREKALTTEILDGLPSTSNIMEVKYNEPETLATTVTSMPEDKMIITESSKSISRSSDAIYDNNQDLFDNPLQKISNLVKGDCLLLEDKNGDATSTELILSRSNGDIPTRNIESQEDNSPNAQSDEDDQELGASNCLETIESQQKSKENDQQESPSDDALLTANRRNHNLVEEKTRSQVKETANNNKKNSSSNELSLGKSLTSVREAILRKLDERKRPVMLNKAAKLKDINGKEAEPIPRSDIEDSKEDCQNEATRMLSTLPDAVDTENRNTKSFKVSDKVQFEDLQKLSDALLKKSLTKEKISLPAESNELKDDELDPDVRGLNDRAHTLGDDNRASIDSDAANDNQFARVVKDPSNRNAIQRNNDDIVSDYKQDTESTCSVDLNDAGKSLRTGPDVNEMTAEASEPVIGMQWHDPLRLFKNGPLSSPLFQDVIVQPTSLFDGIATPSLDLPGALNLPSLDDIRERLASVFGIQAKGSSDEEFDCMDENPIMATAPSTSNLISKLPALPLEDLNLDIFQLKPLPMGKSGALSKTPGLNLKSFRTKVPVPKNLDFKPVRLQSTVGNDGGLLGAALSLGRNTEDAPKVFDSLGNSLQNLPTLEEMMSRVRSNIVPPLDLSRTSSVTPLIPDLSTNIRSNAENTIRALQSRMRSSLGPTNNVLSNSIRNPQELLERLADAKEDLDAKFKGLTYDLNDRLTSIHENLLDKAVLPSLNPLFQDSDLSRHGFDHQNTRFKTFPAQASKKFKSESKKESLGKTANFKNKQKTNAITSPRTFKMPTAASVPVPKTVEAPKLKSIMDKSVFDPENKIKMKPISSRTNPIKLENKLKPNNLRTSKLFEESSVLGKQASQLKNNKVKVTFGSTTPMPIATLRPQQRTDSNDNVKTIDDLKRSDNGLRRRLGLKPKSNVEPHESPSEVQPIFRSALSSESANTPSCDEEISPLRSTHDRTFENQRNSMRATPKLRTDLKSKSADISSTEPDSGSSKSLLPLPSLPKIADNSFLSKVRDAVRDRLANFDPAKPIVTDLNSDIPRKSTDSGLSRNPLPLPSLPKIADNSFLSKVRDAVKDRLANLDPVKPLIDSEPKTTKSCTDMERSASQNTDIVVGDSLKENVSYQCRMVCTKS